MLKRLLALFKRKQSSQKTFEEKLEKLSDPARPRDRGFAKDEHALRMHRALNSGHIRTGGPAATQSRRPFEGRGLSRSASVENRMRNDDVLMQSLMVQSLVNNSTPHRLADVDSCHNTHHTPYHSPSGGYDTTPSDSGGSSDSGGGGSCD